MTISNRAAWILAAATAVAAPPAWAAGTASRPANVVIIVTHDSAPADPSDARRKAGVTFTHAYAAAPQPGPADAAFLTGRSPQRAGFEIDPPTAGKATPEITPSGLADTLNAAGYVTGAFSDEPADAPVVGTAGQHGFAEVGRSTDQATAFIRTHATQPFFAYVLLRASDHHQGEQVDQVTAALHDAGPEAGTLLVLIREPTAAPWTLHGQALRGEWTLIRPGTIPAGRVIDQNVGGVDLAPTVLAALNVAPTEGRPSDGVNLFPLMLNPDGDPIDHPLFWRLGPQYAVQQAEWKLVKAAVGKASPRLYYLGNDPAEELDLFKQQKQRAAALQAAWDAWNVGNQPPRWTDARWDGQPSETDVAGGDTVAAAGAFGPFQSNDSLQGKKAPVVAGKPLEISADVDADGSDGVIVSQGGAAHGYAIYVLDGKLQFAVREGGNLTSIAAEVPLGKGPFSVRAALKDGGRLTLAVNGSQVASGEAGGLIPQQPKAGLFIGKAGTGAVADYPTPGIFGGKIRNLKIKVG